MDKERKLIIAGNWKMNNTVAEAVDLVDGLKRELSQVLNIHPNTAHKVVAELTRTGMLDVMPGLGTVVARRRKASVAERRELLSREVEQLVGTTLKLIGRSEASLG